MILFLQLVLSLSFGCADRENLKPSTSYSTNQNKREMIGYSITKSPSPSEHPFPFTTDRYFEFMFREQELRWEEMEKRKEIERKYEGSGDDPAKHLAKEQEIMELALEMGKKRKALFAEFGITPDKFAAATDSSEAKKEREVYLRFNHEIKEKLMQYQKRQKMIQAFYQSLK